MSGSSDQVYALPPAGKSGARDDWEDRANLDFTPSPRQALLMAAVQRAMATGLENEQFVESAVAADLRVSAELLERNESAMLGGDFRYDIFFARDALSVIDTRSREVELSAQLQINVGDKLGAIAFTNGKKIISTVVVDVSASDGRMTITGKRGSQGVRISCGALPLREAIKRAHELEYRKDTFEGFLTERVAARRLMRG